MEKQTKRFYEFGPFCLDTTERILLREGEPVQLTPKAFDTLCLLVQNSGRVLEKDELMKCIWPNSFVEEATLAQNIFTLRKILGSRPDEQQYIETVPRRGYRFVAKVNEWSSQEVEKSVAEPVTQPSEVKSIAVLPFRTLSQDGSDEFFGLGMADALITRLSNIRKIIVRPTSAVIRFASSEHEPISAGRELRADLILEGKIQKSGDRIRVTVQLICVETGAPLWAEKFDERFVDIFAVQDTISGQVVEALTLQLTGDEKKQLTKRHTDNSEAYQDYLKGRYQWNKWREDGFKTSIKYFLRAIEREPDFALAYAGLADAYNALAFYGYISPHDAMPQVKYFAEKALKIDEALAEGHLPLAAALAFYDWDWVGAEKEFKRALRLNPGYAMAYHGYGLYLIAMGRFDEAKEKFGKALEIDPISPLINTTQGFPYYYAGQYEAAMEQYLKTLEWAPNFGLAHVSLADVYIQMRKYEDAIAEYYKGMTLLGRKLNMLPSLGFAYAVSGETESATEILEELHNLSEHQYVTPIAMAFVHAGLGQVDDAFIWLHKAYEERSHRLAFLNVHPNFQTLRADKRFKELLEALGITPLSVGFAPAP